MKDDGYAFSTPCGMPQAMNVGRLQSDVNPLDDTLPAKETIAEVYRAGNDRVRLTTGKKGAAVLIRHDGDLVAVLWPHQVAEIVRFWLED